MKLPPGYRFKPLEEELITLYLKPRVLAQQDPFNAVQECQLYGPNANPWHLLPPDTDSWLLSEVSPGKLEKVTYVFVSLTKKSGKMKNNPRAAKENYTKKAGCGTWDGQTKRYEIRERDSGDLVGERRFLVFEINDVEGVELSKVGHWKMHEFHLSGVNERIANPCNVVLCKITLDLSKGPLVKLKNVCDPPVKSGRKFQHRNANVDRNQGPVSCQRSRRDSEMLESGRVEEKEGDKGNNIVEMCDRVECMSIDHGNDCAGSVNSPSEQVNTENFEPAMIAQENKEEESGRGKFLFGMTKVQFSGHSNPQEEDSV
ncbi:hypothetical protein DCAR_0103896 [Daucus carota subsp. sativus]|uniref:NAC domain-containing protein n=1 Tax=Daucus carota subsp. sativus TaxID=79200 RepID=A0AAF0W7J2_DAUCS|nr:hypothetical protein DCAR_0103896 [Daucus carota subsp. sativus]